MFAGKKSAQIREILISESAWEEMTCLFAPSKEQLDYLNQNNITFQQGYYFYKPVTYIDLVKIILSKPKVKVVVE